MGTYSDEAGGTALRVRSVAAAASITPNVGTTDVLLIGTAAAPQAVDLTLNNPNGTATDEQSLEIRIIVSKPINISFGSRYFGTSTPIPTALEPGVARLLVKRLTANSYDLVSETLDAPPPTVAFSASTSNVGENAGPATATLTLSRACRFDVSVPFTLSGTATVVTDYTAPTSPAVIPAGSTSVNISIPIIDNAVAGGNKTIILTMGTPSFAIADIPSTHTVTIVDDENALTSATQAWQANVTTNGGTISAGDTSAVDAFFVSAAAHGYLSEIVTCGAFVGTDFAAKTTPLVKGPAAIALASVGTGTYSGSDIGTHGGILSVANRGFDLGMFADDSPMVDMSTGMGLLTDLLVSQSVSNKAVMGAIINGGKGTFVNAPNGGDFKAGIYNLDGFNVGGGSYIAGLSPTSQKIGFLYASRRSSTDVEGYRNGTSIQNVATASTSGNPHKKIYVLGQNFNDALSNADAGAEWWFYCVTLGMSSAHVTSFNTDLHTLMAALGRSY